MRDVALTATTGLLLTLASGLEASDLLRLGASAEDFFAGVLFTGSASFLEVFFDSFSGLAELSLSFTIEGALQAAGWQKPTHFAKIRL
jgi:hypothetical protein